MKADCPSVTRPPSTATVIGIQGDGESLLEERRGGDSQNASSGETDWDTLYVHALLSHPGYMFALLLRVCSFWTSIYVPDAVTAGFVGLYFMLCYVVTH